MLSVSDILGLLDRWEPWKRITRAPQRLDALEAALAGAQAVGAARDPRRAWALAARIAEALER
ncbi:hypothetical protein FKB34_01940 [Glycocaulis profundi]|nr:hypothetical protein FKB34_01940 [Glycocaulis profundi]